MFAVLIRTEKPKPQCQKISINLNLICVHNLDGYSFVKDKWMMHNSLEALEDCILSSVFLLLAHKLLKSLCNQMTEELGNSIPHETIAAVCTSDINMATEFLL